MQRQAITCTKHLLVANLELSFTVLCQGWMANKQDIINLQLKLGPTSFRFGGQDIGKGYVRKPAGHMETKDSLLSTEFRSWQEILDNRILDNISAISFKIQVCTQNCLSSLPKQFNNFWQNTCIHDTFIYTLVYIQYIYINKLIIKFDMHLTIKIEKRTQQDSHPWSLRSFYTWNQFTNKTYISKCKLL